jgi:hypothetical protein
VSAVQILIVRRVPVICSQWNHTFAPIYLGAVSPQAPILFAVTDGGKETVGLLTMQIAQFLAMIDHANKLVGGDKQVHLAMRRKDGTEKGDVYLSCTWTPAPQPAPVQPQPITPLQPMPASAPRTSNAPLPQQMQQPMMQQQPQPMSMQPMQPMMQPQPMPYAMPAQHPQMVQQSYMPPVGTVLMTQPVPITVQGGYAPIPQQPMHPMQQPYTQPAYYPPPQQPLQMSPQGYYPQPPNQMPMSAPAQPMHAVSPSWQPAPSADEGVFQFSELKITRLIGEGMFGTVSAGEFRSTPVAVKQLKQLQFSPAQHQEFMDETKFLREARHPNIVLFSQWNTET